MNISILQILFATANKIEGKYKLIVDDDIDVYSDAVLEDCKECARELTRVALSQINDEIRAEKAGRKKQGLVINGRNLPRAIYLSIGNVKFERDQYKQKGVDGCRYPVDEIVGIRKREKVSCGVSAELVTSAAQESYERSTKHVTGGALSRQTVRNKILRTPVLEVEPEESGKEQKELHVFADEDHAHLQRPGKEKGKKLQIIPMVTVTEGIDTTCERHETIDPTGFVDENFDTRKLWEDVDAFIAGKYDVNNIQKIYVHADGGNWIRNGLSNYTQTVHVIDEFHLEKYLTKLKNLVTDKMSVQRLRATFKKDDKAGASRIMQGIMQENDPDTDKYKKIQKVLTYLKSNWDPIVTRVTEDIPGSCTEPLISHGLSERFSRNPMGWSKEALGKISKVRIYLRNNGKLDSKTYRQTEKPEASYKIEFQEILDGKNKLTDFSIFEKEAPVFDQESGTQELIKKLSYGGYVF